MTEQSNSLILTHPQQSIWYLERMNPDSGIGNISGTLWIEEELDYECYQDMANDIVRRNEGMRLRMREENGQIVQYLADYEFFPIGNFDFTGKSQEALYSWDKSQANIPFQLLNANLFYFAFLKISPKTCGFYIRIHHLIADAWSVVLISNAMVRYLKMLQEKQPWPEDPKPSYLEYMRSEQEYLQSERYAVDHQFWLNQYVQRRS